MSMVIAQDPVHRFPVVMTPYNRPPPPYHSAPASGPTPGVPTANGQRNNRQYGATYSRPSEQTLLIVQPPKSSEHYHRLQCQVTTLAGVLLLAVIASIILIPWHFQLDKEVVKEHQQRLQDMRDWVDGELQLLTKRENVVRRAEERLGHDVERMREANLYWDQPSTQGRACSGWKTRLYSAQLHHIPDDVVAINWCQKTPIDVPGFKFAQPEYCEEMSGGSIVGHWTLRDDKDCHTYWGRKKDLGCQDGLPGNRLIEMQLMDHHKPWDTGKQMCATTPWGESGQLPLICDDREKHGIWGKWLVPDEACL